jgi:hypothetical protein
LADAGFVPERAAHEQIEIFSDALKRQRRGQRATSDTAMLIAPPTRSGPEADVAPLLDLAQAFAQAGIT